jgi:diketogulonate reductase-like aldo/keto reductase
LKLMLSTGFTLAAVRAAQADAPPTLRRAIPRTGETIPAVGLGTWQTFDVDSSESATAPSLARGPRLDPIGEKERAPLREVLKQFVALGGSVVDSSPMYGASERVVGDLAAELGAHGKLFLATKVWTDGRAAGIEQMEDSLRLLRAERIDLMQVHNLLDWRTHIKTLREWKQAGRIRYIGITHYHSGAYDELERVMKEADPDFVQLNYSIVSREAERRLLPLAAERRMAVLVNRPFEGAALFRKVRDKPLPPWAAEFDCASWAQFFLKFILSHPAVSCAIPATSKVKHLVDNMHAGRGRLPDRVLRERMAQHLHAL